jgi:hypothetical protein
MYFSHDLSLFLAKLDTVAYCTMQVTTTKGQHTAAKARWNSHDVDARRYAAFRAASKV